MTDFMRVACAQINLAVGDVDGNTERIGDAMAWAEECGADVLLLPELAIAGYPPEDLVLRKGFVDANLAAMHRLAKRSGDTVTVVGVVDREMGGGPHRDDAGPPRLHNAAALLAGGRVRGIYHKAVLPNYGVFDEDRYFMPAHDGPALWEINEVVAGVSICEDIWVPDGPPSQQAAGGADILLNVNGSPYRRGKGEERLAMLRERVAAHGLPIVYLNLVGGQDELVFDGDSMVLAGDGELLYRAPQFEEEMFWVDVPLPEEGRSDVEAIVVSRGTLIDDEPEPAPEIRPRLDGDAEVYRALCLALADYVDKNGFPSVVVGLSGGIDSALTAAIAADALGPDRVWGITMPGPHSSVGSVEDSRALAEALGIRFSEVAIDEPFRGFLEALGPVFADAEPDVTEENLQARTRGAILMAISNKYGGMVLATGNKSEMAVGYATLYGDMAGGYAVLKDVFKTDVYRLAEWRNRDGEVIPRAIIDKPPSAELAPGQLDTDSLPPYGELDPILERYVERDMSAAAIVGEGFPSETVAEITGMVDRNEYKRRQAPPGVRVSRKALGRDRRLPITNGWVGG